MSDWREKIAGRRVVAMVSGGKDSAALSLWFTEQGIEHERLFADTAWEHPATYEYLRGPLTAKLGPISEVGSRGGMVAAIAAHGMFPSRVARFCTEDLKTKPTGEYLASLKVPTVCAVGNRAEESAKRAAQLEWEPADDIYGADCLVWRPLLRWTLDDVIAIHKRHGLEPNPLYMWGAERVGCWPCILSHKDEIRMVADRTPERILLLRGLEAHVSAQRGALRAFFDASRGAIDPEATPAQPIPIEEVVKWSRTSRGGKQFAMFARVPRDSGCVRWGLCDSPVRPSSPSSATPEKP
jgi:3'-phosphoadenosine 5'-phosphosulfate sulfotransferase (PAPS reductase)/FAD synthetase